MRAIHFLAILFIAFSQTVMAQMQSEMWIECGKQRIFGVLSKPANPQNEKQPIAIIGHGFNPTEFKESMEVAEGFLKESK